MNIWASGQKIGNSSFTGETIYTTDRDFNPHDGPGSTEYNARIAVVLFGLDSTTNSVDLSFEGRPDDNCDWFQLRNITGFEGFGLNAWMLHTTTPIQIWSIRRHVPIYPQMRFRAISVPITALLYEAYILW